MKPLPELLTAREVAEALRVDIHTVTRWARTEQIGCVRLGKSGRTVRFPRAEVERLLRGSNPAEVVADLVHAAAEHEAAEHGSYPVPS